MQHPVVDLSAPAVPSPRTPRRVPVRPPWTCANCDTPNLGRRKRCTDCGTLRS